MENKNKCITKILPDLPADEDAFGSHKLVAEAVANLICEEDGGKAIALKGALGVGKSTVVTLLKKELDSDKSIGVFVFDAWTHRGDPLRIVFLEELIKFLSSPKRGWVSKERWENQLLEIKRLKEVTNTTATPRITKVGLLFAISMLFFPLGYIFFDKFLDKLTKELLIWGLVFWALPFLVVLFVIIVLAARLLGHKFLKWKKPGISFEDIALWFIHKDKETITTSTVKTPEPTSVEFGKVFDSVVNEALSTEKRKLIIVIDNLDRVDEEDALSIWATMRAFFGEQPWLKRFWLLVPFDPISIKYLWMKEERLDNEKNVSGWNKGLPGAFSDKTFQTSFHVPPPIITDCETFFIQQLKVALPVHLQGDDFHVVYRLFYRKKYSNEYVTPRDIKIFINRLGSLHRQWHDDIPLATQSLYVLYENEIQGEKISLEFLHKLIEQDLMRRVAIVDREWSAHFAALHFGKEKDKAIQILIRSQLEEALINMKHEVIDSLKVVYGFWHVCEDIIETDYVEWSKNNPSALAHCALMLKNAGNPSEASQKSNSYDPIWKSLRLGIDGVLEWDNFSEKIGQGISAILETCQKGDFSLDGKILKAISASKFVGDTGQGEDWNKIPLEVAESWISGLFHVTKQIVNRGGEDIIKTFFRVPGSPAFYMKILAAFQKCKDDQSNVDFLQPEFDLSSLIPNLTFEVQEGDKKEYYPDAVSSMLQMQVDWAWKDLVPKFEVRLRGTNKFAHLGELIVCMKTLLILVTSAKCAEINNYYKKVCEEGHILNHLYNSSIEVDNDEALAFCILFMLENLPAGNIRSQVGNSVHGSRLYEKILEQPSQYPRVVDYLAKILITTKRVAAVIDANLAVPKTKKIMTELLKSVLQNSEQKNLKESEVIKYYDYLAEIVSGEQVLDNYLKIIIVEQSLVEELGQIEASSNSAPLFLKVLQLSDGDKAKTLIDKTISEFKNIVREDWLKHLEAKDTILEILFFLIVKKTQVHLGDKFHDALLDYIKAGKLPGRLSREEWISLPDALEDYWRQTFINSLRDYLTDSEGEKTKILSIYGKLLIESKTLEEAADKVIRKLFAHIIQYRIKEDLIWLEECIKTNPEILIKSKSAKSETETFKDRVKVLLGELKDDGEVSQIIRRIAEFLKVKPEDPKQ